VGLLLFLIFYHSIFTSCHSQAAAGGNDQNKLSGALLACHEMMEDDEDDLEETEMEEMTQFILSASFAAATSLQRHSSGSRKGLAFSTLCFFLGMATVKLTFIFGMPITSSRIAIPCSRMHSLL
jgi:hypothetical protein